MNQMQRLVRVAAVATALVVGTGSAPAQSKVKVEIDEVVDNRFSEGLVQGALEVHVKLDGDGLDRVAAARVIVKEARDDKGSNLAKSKIVPDFQTRDTNGGRLDIGLTNPPRSASSVTLSGNVELFVPARDPNAVIRVGNPSSNLDRPFASKQLSAAKIVITPMSRAKYEEHAKSQKLDEAKIAEARAEGKRQGVSDEEIELAIEMMKAFESLGGSEDLPPGAVILKGKESDFDRILAVRILDASGEEIGVNGRSTRTMGEETVMILHPREEPPKNASLEFTILTEKATMRVPFTLKNVPLP